MLNVACNFLLPRSEVFQGRGHYCLLFLLESSQASSGRSLLLNFHEGEKRAQLESLLLHSLSPDLTQKSCPGMQHIPLTMQHLLPQLKY